jgi:hypothetical protein
MVVITPPFRLLPPRLMAANPFLFNQLDVLGRVNRTPQGVTFTSVALMSANDSFSRMIVIQPMA